MRKPIMPAAPFRVWVARRIPCIGPRSFGVFSRAATCILIVCRCSAASRRKSSAASSPKSFATEGVVADDKAVNIELAGTGGGVTIDAGEGGNYPGGRGWDGETGLVML